MIKKLDDSNIFDLRIDTKDRAWYSIKNVDGGTSKKPYGFVDIKTLEKLQKDLKQTIDRMKKMEG